MDGVNLSLLKVNPDSLRSHVAVLLQALVCCFKDDSWPVRDGMLLVQSLKL